MRSDKRKNNELRRVKITTALTKYPEGSVFFEIGETKVLCNATVKDDVPRFLKGKGQGWITAEYSMLPRATHIRGDRERYRVSGRTHEIQRLIGRTLRGVVDLNMLGERTIILDCDVIQADGGTRTASITGGCIALFKAIEHLKDKNLVDKTPLKELVSAVSVGIVDSQLLLDLNYEEDSSAEVDMNIIMTASGKIIEIQGTAEKQPFSKKQLDNLIQLAKNGIKDLTTIQKKFLKIK